MITSSINILFQTTVSRSPDLIYSEIDDEIAILSITNEEYYYLDKVGSTILKYLDEPKCISNIISMLTEQYEILDETCKSETIQYIEELFNLGIIDLKNE